MLLADSIAQLEDCYWSTTASTPYKVHKAGHSSTSLIVRYCYGVYELSTNSQIMFNALNRFIARLDSDSPAPAYNHGAFGFQVLRNKNLELAIEPWFDFIVGINGRMIV
jgi:hypothetical protein